MNKNKSPFKNQNKRLYYQYLGFVNSVNLFSQEIMGMEHFEFTSHSISYEAFQDFSIELKMPLGKRVERFFEFYIEQNERYNMVKKNVQINHEKTTIGEFDFFLEDTQTKQIIHVELVYKFYIYKEAFKEEIKRYHGPNNHDNLEDKLHKLQSHQFPLLFNPYAKEALAEFELLNVKQRLCFLGNLFVEKKADFELVNPNALAGTYMSFKKFMAEYSSLNKRYFIPQKEDWLVEVKHGEFWFNYDQTVAKIEKYFKRNNSLLLWIKNDHTFSKMFVLREEKE